MLHVRTALVSFLAGAVFVLSAILTWQHFDTSSDQLLPSLVAPVPSPKPLLAYTIPTLQARSYTPRALTIESVLEETDTHISYLAGFTPLDRQMSVVLNVPKPVPTSAAAIVMIRGYAPVESYTPGTGTRNAGRALADAGFVTVAPDFFGYGESDPEPTDTWQARFEKPIVIIELLRGLQIFSLTLPEGETIQVTQQGIWGHSNGGQIALTTLEALREPVPTVLWAPVTAPFPYSILYFSDENDDEGKEMRKYVSLFEKDYDVFDFSLTKHLDSLQASLQIHHGTADDSALKSWSDEFIQKIDLENQRRSDLAAIAATGSASATASATLSPIEVEYFGYPGANHNLTPGWQTAMDRTIEFFHKHF